MSTFMEMVAAARSIRRFDHNVKIDRETLEKIIDIARICPSAANRQPLRYRLVYTDTECAAVFPSTAWAGAIKDWKGPEPDQRPAAYIAMLYETGNNPPDLDAGIAGQTIQLAAYELGYGCCMLGALRRDDIKQTLNIPEQYSIIMLLALGKPAEKPVIETVDDGQNTSYWRDENSIHHVPKRKLEDIITN